MIPNMLGGFCVGAAIILAANVVGIVAHYGLLPNGNPANPFAIPLMVWTLASCVGAAFFFSYPHDS